jgi:hypothetical protein
MPVDSSFNSVSLGGGVVHVPRKAGEVLSDFRPPFECFIDASRPAVAGAKRSFRPT